jgi:hypothetical protein
MITLPIQYFTPSSRMKRFNHIVAIFFLLCMAAACTAAKLADLWEDREFTGAPFKKLFVINIAASPATRLIVEKSLSTDLRSQHIEAIAGRQNLSEEELGLLHRITPWLREQAIDAILLTRFLPVGEQTDPPPDRFIPAEYYQHYDSYYRAAQDYCQSAGDPKKTQAIKLETNLYEAASGKLVWSGRSELVRADSLEHTLKSLGPEIVAALLERDIIAP